MAGRCSRRGSNCPPGGIKGAVMSLALTKNEWGRGDPPPCSRDYRNTHCHPIRTVRVLACPTRRNRNFQGWREHKLVMVILHFVCHSLVLDSRILWGSGRHSCFPKQICCAIQIKAYSISFGVLLFRVHHCPLRGGAKAPWSKVRLYRRHPRLCTRYRT